MRPVAVQCNRGALRSNVGEPASTITHALGAILFALLALPLIRRGRTGRSRLALAIFAGSAVLLLASSAFFHGLPVGSAARVPAQRVDHAAIFLLIAGTFTPIHVLLFTGPLRWGPLAIIWTGAVVGITLKSVLFASIPEWLGIGIYLAMGWSGAVAIAVTWRRHGLRFVSPLLLGGCAYTAGAVCEFTGQPVLVPGVFGSHEMFHLAVLVGLGSMWAFIRRIAPGANQAARPALAPSSDARLAVACGRAAGAGHRA